MTDTDGAGPGGPPLDRPPVVGRPPLPRAEVAWAVGCTALVLHVVAAFHFRHGWSHDHAVAETARQTRAVTGIDWGGGVWFNHATVAIWMADVVLRGALRAGSRRLPRPEPGRAPEPRRTAPPVWWNGLVAAWLAVS